MLDEFKAELNKIRIELKTIKLEAQYEQKLRNALRLAHIQNEENRKKRERHYNDTLRREVANFIDKFDIETYRNNGDKSETEASKEAI